MERLGKRKPPEVQHLLLSDKTADVHVPTLNTSSDLAKTLCKAVKGKCAKYC